MTNTVAKITSKIVDITDNPETKKFIGKIVTRKETDKGAVVYAIGSTGYILRPAEYKMFAEAGAIAQASLFPKSKKSQKAAASDGAQKSVCEALDAEIAEEKAEQQSNLETSTFLMNYPKPSFDMDAPKHLAFLDKKDDLKTRASRFFDKIGKNGRDKLIEAMSD